MMEIHKNTRFFNIFLLPALAGPWQKQVALSFILFFFSACETVIEIEIPVEKPKLVVNSIYNADSILTVNITKSRPSSEPGINFEKIENAVVEVLKNNQSLGLLSYAGQGNYRTSARFTNEPNAEYKLIVNATDFGTAEATELIPEKPMLSSFNMNPANNNNGTSYKSYNPGFILHDSNESNYYTLKVSLIYPSGLKRPIPCALKNNLGQFSPLRSDYLQIQVFNDQSFNGKELTLNLEIFQIYIADPGVYKIIFELASINKSYFDYLYSVKRQFEDIPLLEPKNLPLYNNIKNGLGIFAPYNASTFSVEVVR